MIMNVSLLEINDDGTIIKCTASGSVNCEKISLDIFIGLNYEDKIKDCKIS